MSRMRVTSRSVIPYIHTKYTRSLARARARSLVYVGAESREVGLPSVSVPED